MTILEEEETWDPDPELRSLAETLIVRLVAGYPGFYFVEFIFRNVLKEEFTVVIWTWPGSSVSAEQAFAQARRLDFYQYEGMLAKVLEEAQKQGLDRPEKIAELVAKAQAS